MDWSALESLRDKLPEGQDVAPEQEEQHGSGETLHIQLERKGRAGKTATIVFGFTNSTDDQIADIASRLKRSLGCGGSSRGGEILLQGDRTASLRPLLQSMGYKVK